MAKYLPLPNGASLKVPDTMSYEEAMAKARERFPELFAEKPSRDTTGFKAAMSASTSRLQGEAALTAAKIGLMDPAKAEEYYKAKEQEAQARFTPTEEGWSEAPLQKFKETLGGSIPYMVAPAAAGLAALAAPVARPTAQILGAAGAFGAGTGQFTGTNLARQMETGKTLEETSGAAALAAAIPQAALDTAAMALLPGVGRLFGSVGAKLTTEQAKAIAKQTLTKTLADYAATTGAAMGREGVTEATQQVLERLQAGLSISDPEARAEYIESFIGGAALAGVGAPIGRFTERGAAKDQAALAERRERAEATVAEQQRLAQAQAEEEQRLAEETAAAEAERNSPAYALRVAQEYTALEQKLADLKAQVRKGTKEKQLTAEDRAFNEEINKQLKTTSAELKKSAAEKNRVTQSGLLAQAQEEQQREQMSPMEYMLEQTGEVPESKFTPQEPDMAGFEMPEPVTPTMRREAEAAATAARPEQYAAERMRLAQDQMLEPTGADYVEYLMADPYMASRVVETRTPLPGLSSSESSLIRNSLASRLKKEAKVELEGRQAELKAQATAPAAPANPMEQFLADQDAMDVARQEGMTEAEIAQIEQLAKMPTSVVDQGELFPGEQRVGQSAGVSLSTQLSDKLGELQRQLEIAKAQRNTERGGQYMETIRGLREQISDILSRAPLPTVGGLGKQTADLQGLLGGTPESLRQQQAAQAQREEGLTRLANKDADARLDVLDSLISEIKAVRGDLRPETITQIERQAAPLLDVIERYGEGYVPDVAAELGAISQQWRSGTERTQSVSRTTVPTETSADMLREQMDRAFAQNDMSTRTERRERYAPEAMALLNQIADNFKAFAANPERRNLAGEWLNRLTTTGVASPEMSADLRSELQILEQGKRSETETPTRQTAFGLATKPTQTAQQLELPSSMLPKEIEGKAPVQKVAAFDTAEEFQKYLASEGLQVLRSSMGMAFSNAARVHKRMEVFRTKYQNVLSKAQDQIEQLKQRKAALEKQKGTEQRTAKELLADAQIRLNNVQEQLDRELHDLQIAYMEADVQAKQSAADAQEIAERIAANVAKFQTADEELVRASQAAAEAKAELAKVMAMPVSKKNFSLMRKTQQAVTEAVRAQRSAAAGAPARLRSFLNTDLDLQLQAIEAIDKKEADARTFVEAKQALDKAAALQKRRQLYKKELAGAQADFAAALQLSGPELRKIVSDIDTELKTVDSELAAASSAARVAQGKLAPKTVRSKFEQAMADVRLLPMTAAERDAATARDRADREAFQDATARLAAIPGTRIDFEKRRAMLSLVEDSKDTRATIDARIAEAETGVEEMEIAAAIAEEGLASAQAEINEVNALPVPKGLYAQQEMETRAKRVADAQAAIPKLQKRLEESKQRVNQLRSYLGMLESQRENFEKAYEKAVRATSSDPDVAKQVTEELDARVAKLRKDIAENEERLKKGEAKSGKKAEKKTLQQARKRLAKYKRELARVENLRSNRLGITRTDVLTGATSAKPRTMKPTAEEAIQIDEAEQRAKEYADLTNEINLLKEKKTKAEAKGQPKAPAMIQARIDVLEAQRDEVAPRPMGKVSELGRKQSSAPSKFRTGTAESKAVPGVARQPLIEQRTVAAPTPEQAVAEANALAARVERARTPEQRAKIMLEKPADERIQLLQALRNNVATLRNQIKMLEEERKTLAGAKAIKAVERRAQIDYDLDGTPRFMGDLEVTGLRTMLSKAEGALLDVTEANEIATNKVTRDLQVKAEKAIVGGAVQSKQVKGNWAEDFELDSFDLGDIEYRVTNKTGTSMQAQAVERLAKRMTADWKNVPEIVVVENERGLPVRILNQVERDKVWGKIPGLYDPKTKKVYLVASNLYDGTDVIATVAHEAAGHYGLQSMLGAGYSPTMRSIYANNSNVRSKAKAKMQANANLSQDVAVEEVLADMAEGDLSPVERTIMQRVYDAIRNFFRKLFGKDMVMTDNQVRQVVANARSFVIEGGIAGEGKAQTEGLNYRTTAEPNALTDLADKISSEPKTTRQKLAGLTALEAEQTGVDMRAGLREALKAGAEGLGDTKLFTQTMYNVLKADQKMPLVYTVMSRGPLEMYKDDKGFYGVRSTNKNSAVDVFGAINELPYGDSKQKMAMAQAYLVAQRALNKGVEKLDIGALGIKEADLQAAIAAANADPALGKALERVRTIYNAYNKGLVDFMAQTGAITKEQAQKLNAGGDYVPFYRVDANGNASLVFDSGTMVSIGDIRRQPYLAELKGGETKLLPLDEAIPRNTILLTDKALTNMAVKSVAYGLQAIGKGAGPVDPKTGKPTNKMAIHSGKGPADPGVIRFNQEPDPSNPDDKGERWLKIDTEGTLAEGVPTALLVKSLEGAHMPLPAFLKLAGSAADILRAGVTRTPLYIARQLLREPMAAAFTGGLNYNTFTAVIKGGNNFVKMLRGNSETEARLLEKGLIQSNIFTGDVDDMGKFAMQIVKGDQAAYEKFFAAMDKVAIKADSSTRALVYENALANGLSEVEADMMTMESMNFYKRGTAPMIQYASRLIPFFNAQIQGLNVLIKAARGRMPFEEQQRIKRKFFNNAVLLAATGVIYALAMEDDETWRNARPRDKMTNFFVPLPGTDEMLKLPIPFEAGYFYSLAVAAVDGMREQTDNKAQWEALKDLFINSIPGASSMGVPQIFKPVAEVWTNKNFLTGAPVESLRLQGLRPEERYNATTTELAKTLSAALPILSPIQIEHIVRGYLGVLPLVAAAGANSLFEREGAGEKPEKRLSELALIGSTFQKKFGGADADVVFEAAKDTMEARNTFNKLVSEGRREEAIAFRNENKAELAMATAAGQYRQLIGRINADLRRTQERADLTPAEKRQRIDKLEEAKQQAAARFLAAKRKADASVGG